MRIVYVTSQVPFGPQEAFILPEVRELRRQGHEVLMVPLRPQGSGGAVPAQDAVFLPLLGLKTLGMALLESGRHPIKSLRLLVRLVRTSRTLKMRLKNLAVFPKGVAAAAAVRAWRPDHVHAHWASTPSTMAYVISGLTGRPWSLTMHRWDIPENNMLAEKLRTAAFARVINRKGHEELRAMVGDDLAGKCRVLHMGVEVPDSLPGHGVDTAPLLLCPANLVEKKGHRYLLEACHLLKEHGIAFRCWLVGDGPLEAELRAQVARLDLGAEVSFQGKWEHGRLLSLYQQGTVGLVVLPSICTPSGEEEGIPVALMEAMAAGIPVVSTDTGGIPELLETGCGLVVAPQSAEGLYHALRRLIQEPELALSLGKRGHARVKADFNLDVVARELAAAMAKGV